MQLPIHNALLAVFTMSNVSIQIHIECKLDWSISFSYHVLFIILPLGLVKISAVEFFPFTFTKNVQVYLLYIFKINDDFYSNRYLILRI